MPSYKEMYVELHSSAGTRCSEKVTSLDEKFSIRKAELESLASETGRLMPSDDEIWFDIIGGPKKSQWTGAQTRTCATPSEGASRPAVDNALVNSIVTAMTPLLMQIRDMCANTATSSGTAGDDADEEATPEGDDPSSDDE